MYFIGLWIFFKLLETDCNRFEQANWIRKSWFKTTNLEELMKIIELQCSLSLKYQKKQLLSFQKMF